MTISRTEVITSVERRRRWSQDEKERLVAASLEPGASVSEVARGRASCEPAVQVAQGSLQARRSEHCSVCSSRDWAACVTAGAGRSAVDDDGAATQERLHHRDRS
ncbi:transposase [Bradyrhizobium sp. 2]|nr:transposase [Bradyrhizobium sp. 2]